MRKYAKTITSTGKRRLTYSLQCFCCCMYYLGMIQEKIMTFDIARTNSTFDLLFIDYRQNNKKWQGYHLFFCHRNADLQATLSRKIQKKSPVKVTVEYAAYLLRKQEKQFHGIFTRRSNPSTFSEVTAGTNCISGCGMRNRHQSSEI